MDDFGKPNADLVPLQEDFGEERRNAHGFQELNLADGADDEMSSKPRYVFGGRWTNQN